MHGRLIVILSACLRLASSVVSALHPPFVALVVVMLLSGLGTAMNDSTLNVYIGTMEHAHELLGLLHGVFGIGCTVGQVFAAVVLADRGRPWYFYYYLQLSLHALELELVAVAFWEDGPAQMALPLSHSESQNNEVDEKATPQSVSTSPLTLTPGYVCNGGSRNEPANTRIAETTKHLLKQNISRSLSLIKRATMHQPAARVTWLVMLYFVLRAGMGKRDRPIGMVRHIHVTNSPRVGVCQYHEQHGILDFFLRRTDGARFRDGSCGRGPRCGCLPSDCRCQSIGVLACGKLLRLSRGACC